MILLYICKLNFDKRVMWHLEGQRTPSSGQDSILKSLFFFALAALFFITFLVIFHNICEK